MKKLRIREIQQFIQGIQVGSYLTLMQLQLTYTLNVSDFSTIPQKPPSLNIITKNKGGTLLNEFFVCPLIDDHISVCLLSFWYIKNPTDKFKNINYADMYEIFFDLHE